ncbi:GNAT family N-acetyltransferase [Chloroflexota bacterium]
MEKPQYKFVTTSKEFEEALEVRKRVFVDEQGVSEGLEFDDCDKEALHIVFKDKRIVIGTARVIFLNSTTAKLERMAILKHFRGKGIGSNIISFLIKELKTNSIEYVVIHAQCSAVAFYKSCGFEETGKPFMEANIRHIKMQKKL